VTYDDERANRIQEIDLELSKFWNNDWRVSQKLFQINPSGQMTSSKPLFDVSKISDPKIRSEVERLMSERQYHVNNLASKLQLRDWSGIGPWFKATFRSRLEAKQEVIEITDLDEYSLTKKINPFPLEHFFFNDYSLRFKNSLPVDKVPFAQDKDERRNQRYLKARLECNGDIISPSGFFFMPDNRSRVYEFKWYFDRVNGQNAKVQFTPGVTSCMFKYYDPERASTWTNGIPLASLQTQSISWMKMSNEIDICARPTSGFGKNPDGFFWQQDFNFTTCPETFDHFVNLRDPYISMNRKIMSLTGSPLNKKDFDNKNPMAKLDFSKAPKFDILWVSSLNFSADFYGMVLARALHYHAEQGTQVRILVPQVTMTRKDREIVQWLMRDTPNIKVQYYKYTVTDDKDGTWFDRYHRVNHMKLLMGHSESDPAADFLITGGRNIRDSYIFPETPFYRAYKHLKNYGDGEEPYIYYNDFEIEVRGSNFIKGVMAQMVNFWMRDPETHRFRSTNINIPAETTASQVARLSYSSNLQPLVRHIMSLPFFDGYQLERFYIEMIDSAQKELVLTTPYFRPSVAISAALDRAHARGVKVKVMTRIHLAGDGTPQIAEEVNKEGINRHLKNIEIYEWTDLNSIMHAKILVIDNKLSFVSSVNLNRRSFIHDTESGVLILHEPTAAILRQEVMNFIKKGRRITDSEKISWINSTLIDWADSYF
jgi:phosphatidylserine/phosphatidylglycerophosphate/cardiolipin synthase-like enzyme